MTLKKVQDIGIQILFRNLDHMRQYILAGLGTQVRHFGAALKLEKKTCLLKFNKPSAKNRIWGPGKQGVTISSWYTLALGNHPVTLEKHPGAPINGFSIPCDEGTIMAVARFLPSLSLS